MSANDFRLERTELERILSSGIFERSPSLAQLLTYICGKYFEGEANNIKEYSIAVDALGRSPDFEQKKDPIVRVQMHRLRKLLEEYYQAGPDAGPDNDLQVVIPLGRYVPRFVRRGAPPAAGLQDSVNDESLLLPTESEHQLEDAIHAHALPSPSEAASARVRATGARRFRWLLSVAAVLVVLFGAAWVGLSSRSAIRTTAAPMDIAVATQPAVESVRILSGLETGTFIDGFGKAWLSDRYFSGGSVVNVGEQLVLGTREPRLYQSRREGMFVYDIPLPPGVYEMRLHFAEMHFGEMGLAGYGGEASRKFGIVVNGNTLLPELDIVGDVGSRTANVKVFRDISPAPDGLLHLRFTPIVSVPFLNAIELTPGVKGRLLPIRIVNQDGAYRDSQGRQWLPDRYAIGGQLVKKLANVSGAADPQLFAGERFGNLKYVIPVPPGKYAVTLYLAERWYGPNLPGGGGAGTRLFDILLNGVALARDFDIFTRAGGPERALLQTFHGMEPNHQGNLELSLIPSKKYAALTALEIIDESPVDKFK